MVLYFLAFQAFYAHHDHIATCSSKGAFPRQTISILKRLISVHAGGHYIFIEGNHGYSNQFARLYTPRFVTTASKVCLSFAYHMYGEKINNLRVQQLEEDDTGIHVWSQSYNQGDNWLTMAKTIDVDSTGTLQLRFQGKRGSTPVCDIAVDDVVISYGDCSLNGEEFDLVC